MLMALYARDAFAQLRLAARAAAALYVYDAAYAPDLASVKSHGGIAINGYLTGKYATSTTQPAAARKAGLGYLPTYEEGQSELVGASVATGKSIGQRILDAFEQKQIPTDGTIAAYPSVDVNVSAGSATSCNNGWEGMLAKLDGKISLRSYAEGAIIDALVKAGLVKGKCWLAAPTSWPGFDVNDPNICLIQLVGTPVAGTDQNHLVTDPSALGAWWPDNSPYGDSLTMDADVKAAFAAINAKLDALPDAVWGDDVIPVDPTNKDNPNWRPTSVLPDIRNHAVSADSQSASAVSALTALKSQVTALQTALNSVAAAVANLGAPAATVDLSGASFPATVTVAPKQ